jgi:hypothetical protein
MEEVYKLTNNPKALEDWLNKFAEEKGIKAPNVNREKLDQIPKEVPSPEKIQREGGELKEKVAGGISETQKKIHEGKKQLNRYQPPTVSPQLSEDMFKLKEDQFRLNLGSDPRKDPRFINRVNNAQKWFKDQPNPLRRAIDDAKDTAIEWGGKAWRFAIDLGKEAINAYNNVNQFDEKVDPKYKNLRYKP